jgi:DNA polymerase III subunit delta'
MRFENVIGQIVLKQKLIGAINSGKVSHAQLFLAPEGSGGLPMALAYAQFLLCENKNENDSCGKCSSCVKAEKLIHPDIHFSFPVITGKVSKPKSADFISEWREALFQNPYLNYNDWMDFLNSENKQGNITAEECHDIVRKLGLKSFEGKYKILILWLPEFLGKEGNILLKTLEEPPPGTLILLVAENAEMILQTILSRTQIVRLNLLSENEIKNALTSSFETEEEDARRVARLAEGSWNEALQLIKNVINPNEQYFRDWMALLVKNNIPELMKWNEEMARTGRESQKVFLRYAVEALREAILFSLMKSQEERIPEREKKVIKYLNETVAQDDLSIWIKELEEAQYHIERNANAKILFMHLSLCLLQTFRRKTVSLSR